MNVWIYVLTNVGTERVFGPFTGIYFEDDEFSDGLTGNVIMRRDDSGVWVLTIDGVVLVAKRVVFQQGGWTSPWGERGK